MKVAVFTFRTFKSLDQLNEIFDDVTVLGKLKEDIELFISRIQQNPPDLILGIAKAMDGYSRFETVAINYIHGKKIAVDGADMIDLFIPKMEGFITAEKFTNSFCNYAAYKIANAVKEFDISIPIAFTHISLNDLKKLHF